MADLIYVPQIQVEWVPPQPGTVKLNFDGGLSRRHGCAVSAGIFRDYKGAPLYSYTWADPAYIGHTPNEAEAKALLTGLDLALKLGFTNLWVEGDAKLLIDIVRSGRPNFCYDEDTVSMIRYVSSLFDKEKLMLTFIEREGNTAADALVRYARDGDLGTRLWEPHHKLPSQVANAVDRERNGCIYERHARYARRPKSCYVPHQI